MPDSFVKFEKVDKSYDGEVLVVKDLNLDIAGVDLLFNNGSYTICEVNSAPGFEGMEKYTNKNIAVEMVNYVVKKIGG